MKSISKLFAALALFLGAMHAGSVAAQQRQSKPDILYIAIDDLRDWVHYLGYQQVKTPNLDRLSQRGVTFTHAYCASPVCNPSRTALMSGQRSSTTGVYSNGIDWRPLVKVPTLNEHFRTSGYYVCGAGKIYHGNYPRDVDWDDYQHERTTDPDDVENPAKGKANNKGKGASEATNDGVGGIKFKPIDARDEDMVDYHTVSYALKQLNRSHDKPLFVACGLHKPHMAWDVPKKYYDMYPLDRIQLPKVLETDLDDVPPAGVRMAKPEGDHAAILASGRWKEAVQGYLAAITFCDAMIGRLIDGFDKSPNKDNTIVMLWSDHGWHLGEKQHWRKFALWEEATRAPFLITAPGVTKPGTVCDRTIDYMSIYPTLCELAGIPIPKHVEGPSIKPLLADPKAAWDRPALTTHGYQNHAVRTEAYRYIRYANGDEELYDEKADPLEWKNLAGDSNYAPVKKDLAQWFPKTNVPTPGGGNEAAAVDAATKKAKRAAKAAKLQAK
jgi:arylsulfatase A-like enzyme